MALCGRMSTKHDKLTKIKLYPKTLEAIKARHNKDSVPPSLTSLVNAAIVKGIKLV